MLLQKYRHKTVIMLREDSYFSRPFKLHRLLQKYINHTTDDQEPEEFLKFPGPIVFTRLDTFRAPEHLKSIPEEAQKDRDIGRNWGWYKEQNNTTGSSS